MKRPRTSKKRQDNRWTNWNIKKEIFHIIFFFIPVSQSLSNLSASNKAVVERKMLLTLLNIFGTSPRWHLLIAQPWNIFRKTNTTPVMLKSREKIGQRRIIPVYARLQLMLLKRDVQAGRFVGIHKHIWSAKNWKPRAFVDAKAATGLKTDERWSLPDCF